MEVLIKEKFEKDLDSISTPKVFDAILLVIDNMEKTKTLKGFRNLKKLAGFTNAYRIRISDYRIGIVYENNIVYFVRVLHRSKIYKNFP